MSPKYQFICFQNQFSSKFEYKGSLYTWPPFPKGAVVVAVAWFCTMAYDVVLDLLRLLQSLLWLVRWMNWLLKALASFALLIVFPCNEKELEHFPPKGTSILTGEIFFGTASKSAKHIKIDIMGIAESVNMSVNTSFVNTTNDCCKYQRNTHTSLYRPCITLLGGTFVSRSRFCFYHSRRQPFTASFTNCNT